MVKALRIVFWLLLTCIASSVVAQTQRDPTQPPAAYIARGNALDSEPTREEVRGPVLQSIIRRHGARPVAIINGETVQLGGRVDDMVLVALTDNEARLKGAAGIEVLVLSPTDGKKPVRSMRPERK